MTTKSEEVKVIGAWPSPFVWRALIALNIKSVKYELIEENFAPKSQLLIQSNPVYKKIPVLIHADTPICESLIILHYIDETWSSGPSILPSHPYDRAIARFWATYFDDKLFPAIRSIAGAEGEEMKKLIKELEEGVILVEEAYNKISKGKDYFGGDQIGYIDIAFGSIFAWLRVVETLNEVKLLDQETTPGLLNWGQKYASHDAVKNVLPQHDRLVEFAKFLKARAAAAAAAAASASAPN